MNRRNFLGTIGTAAVASAWLDGGLHRGAAAERIRYTVEEAQGPASVPAGGSRIRFAVIGINHDHIYSAVSAVLRGGGEFVSFYAKEPDLVAVFQKSYPHVRFARSEAEILEDPTIQLVVSSITPFERAPLGIRAMRHGKDYLCDKPGITTLEQLAEVRKVQEEMKRIYSVLYSGRLESKAAVKAGELVKAGAIGRVLQTINMASHQVHPANRPEWFWNTANYGGILCDLGSHQADEFLYFTGSTSAHLASAQVGNLNHKERPHFEDFGDAMLVGNAGTGYFRVDWFSPDGLGVWGDARLFLLGTDGYIELRNYIDIAGRKGGEHLFLVDQKQTVYMDCNNLTLPFGPHFVSDILDRTETAQSQRAVFLAAEITLQAQKSATALTIEEAPHRGGQAG